MSKCTDNGIGRLLHAYELGQLDGKELERFEEHLLHCDYCFHEVNGFDQTARLLSSDTEIADLAAEAASRAVRRNWLERFRESLWPSGRPWLLRPAVAYIAVALMAYPAYQGLRDQDGKSVQSAQTLIMSGTRGSSQSTMLANEPLTLVFRVPGASAGDTLVLLVEDGDGVVQYSDSTFTSLSDTRLGSLTIDADAIPPGEYTLKISSSDGSDLSLYRFDLR